MMLGTDATAAEVQALRDKLGLNRPLLVQYATYLAQTVQLNLGECLRLTQPAVALVAERIPTTGKLALTAIIIAVLISFPLGIAAALRPGGLLTASCLLCRCLGSRCRASGSASCSS